MKGYAAHERGVFDSVTEARSSLLRADTPGAAAQANDVLTSALGRLFAVAEAYPDLKASQNFLRLQDELTDTEDKIAAARRYYNATVMRYNTKIQSFPGRPLRRCARVHGTRVLLGRRGRPRAAPGRPDAARRRSTPYAVTLQEQIRANRFRSVVLIGGFAVIILILAALLAAALDVWVGAFALAGALIYAVFGILSSRGMVASMTGAHELPPEQLRPIQRLVDTVAIAAGLTVTPQVRIVDDPAPNAFATGLTPGKSFIGITTGLLATMPKRELEAVIAHEMSHVRNRDTRLMTLAVVFAGVIALIANIAFRTMAFGGGGAGGTAAARS